MARLSQGERSALGALASLSRLQILRHLQRSGGALTVAEVAAAVGLHVNTTREHLERLVAAAFATRMRQPRRTRGRPRSLYRAVTRPAGASLDAWLRENLVRMLADEVADDSAAARQLVALEAHLEDLDLAPEVTDGAVHLWRCPFAPLARQRTDLVCEVHLELIRGVLAHEGGPVTAERLVPFVGPQHCLLHLGLTTSVPQAASAATVA